MMQSLPPFPLITLLPALASIKSLPGVPSIMSAPWVPVMTLYPPGTAGQPSTISTLLIVQV
jgi:hypothetical protein